MSRQTIIFINFLTIFLIGFFLTFPQYQNLMEINFKIQEKRTELQYKKEYFSNLKEISEELKKYESELLKIDSALPSDPFLPSLFNFISNTASENGLFLKDVKSFSITPLEKKPEIKEISLEITVIDSYPAFKNFLSALEKTARLIEVENITISYPKVKDEPFSFDLKIKAHSY